MKMIKRNLDDRIFNTYSMCVYERAYLSKRYKSVNGIRKEKISII